MWKPVNRIDDAPDHDCLVAFTLIDDHIPGEILDDPSNLGACVGYLEWARDKSFWSIIESGEVVTSGMVTAICELAPTNNIRAGKGAHDRSAALSIEPAMRTMSDDLERFAEGFDALKLAILNNKRSLLSYVSLPLLFVAGATTEHFAPELLTFLWQ